MINLSKEQIISIHSKLIKQTGGLLSHVGYMVESNYEHSLGRSDIVIKDRKSRQAVIIEVKIADAMNRMEKECDNALQQIE